VCCWYLGARPSRGARARARAGGPPRPVGVRQHGESRKHFPYTYGSVQKYTSDTNHELELIQTQMTQKPMLRAEVYARALRASQNRKEDSV